MSKSPHSPEFRAMVSKEYLDGLGSYEYLAVKHFYEAKEWSINWMCKQLGITRTGYYKWLHRDIPVQEQENQKLAELIKEYDERFCHILGYRRMASWLNHFNHTCYSPKRVHRIMKKLNIHAVIRKKRINITHPLRKQNVNRFFHQKRHFFIKNPA